MDINEELSCAIQQGNLDKLRELIGISNLRTPSEAERGYVLLHKAIEWGHKEMIEFFLQRGALVNAPGNTECVKLDSPLIIAIRKEDVSLVQTLLDLGASVNETIHFRQTPLIIAIDVGNAEIVKLLVRNNADVKFECESNRTILDLVARSKKLCLDTDIVELLIDKGATLLPYPECIHGAHQTGRKKNEGLTQLHLAVNRGYLSVVEHLLKRGASGNSTCTFNGREGYTPLHIACNDRTAECLLRYGADVNVYAEGDLTPLHVAVGKKCTDLVELLLTRGANVDASDRDGKTALVLAVEMLHLPTVDRILKSLPNVENQGNRKSLNAAVLTYDYDYELSQELDRELIIASLLNYGFTVRPQDPEDCDMLRKAIEMGLLVVIDDFLKHCVDINAEFFRDTSKGREGFTLLHAACKDSDVNVVRRFLDKGAEIDARAKNGNTPLHEAVLREHKDIVELLLDAGANIDHQNEYGYSALSLAVEKGNADIVEIILKHGPDINNKANKKSIRVAVVNKNTFRSISEYGEIVKSLYRYGFSMDSDILHDSELLKEAIEKGYLNIVENFLKYNTKGELLSFTCGDSIKFDAQRIQKDIIRLLISYEADMNINDSPEPTPIFYAMVGGPSCSVIVLLSCTCGCCDTYFGARYKVRNNGKECAEIVDIFLRHGADPEIINGEGQRPYYYAYTSNMVETGKLLVRQRANLTDLCRRSITPFYIAIERNRFEFVILFLERIVPDFKSEMYRKLLEYASSVHNSILLEVPLKSGADINSVDENGETPLEYAWKNEDTNLVLDLLEHGADVTQIIDMIQEPDDPDSFDFSITYILMRHMAKLILAGLVRFEIEEYVDEYDEDFVTQCSVELDAMKKENVPDTSVNFRDILTNDTHRLATYAKNETLVKFLTSEKCRTKFPLYSSVMKGLIWRGIVRKCLLERSIIVFHSYGGFFCELADVCVEQILNHLNDEELRIFTRFNSAPSGIETNVDPGFFLKSFPFSRKNHVF